MPDRQEKPTTPTSLHATTDSFELDADSKLRESTQEVSGSNCDGVGESPEESGILSRRRMLQLAGVGVAAGSVATVASGSDDDSDLPKTIVLDGTAADGTAHYEFLVSGSTAIHDEYGGERPDGGHVRASLAGEKHGYRFEGTLSYLDVDGDVTVTIHYGEDDSTDDDDPIETDRLEIVAASDATIEYTFRSEEPVEKVLDNGDNSADEGEDEVIEEDDGTWRVEGSTANGYGDTYDLQGEVTSFEPVTDEFTLFLNGEETTVAELLGYDRPDTDRQYSLTVEASADGPVDCYIEVDAGGALEALDPADDDAVWFNDDGTKVAGRLDPSEERTFVSSTAPVDVTIDGDGRFMRNGMPVDVSDYPLSGAAGDHWKGYFPWHLEGEERTHHYYFEATGDEPVNYFFEVEDGGELIPSTVADAVIEYEFFWIDEDQTKAAGQIQPGDTHAYEFDTLVADVTIDGEADPYVNGSPSNMDLYPRDPATGDDWKTGFPWLEDDYEPPTDDGDDGEDDGTTDIGIRHDRYDGPLGGGDGYPDVIDEEEADIVVPRDMSLQRAAWSASAGDVVYIENGARLTHGSGTITWSQDDLTIAASRGDTGVDTGHIVRTGSGVPFELRGDGIRLTGLSIDGSGNGGTCIEVRARNVLIDNCLIRDNSYSSINVRQNNPNLEVRQNRIVDNAYGGTGYGLQLYWSASDRDNRTVIRYNEFGNNRRDIAGSTSWFEAVDNRIESRGVGDPGHGFEVRAENQDVGEPAGNAIVHHNELREDGTRLLVIRGVPTDGVTVERNWAYWDSDPVANAGYWGSSGVVLQPFSDQAPQFSGVFFEANHWGTSNPE